jgi:hypothetical protein
MTAGLIAPFEQLFEEGYRIFNVGADVAGLTGYFSQRLQLVKNAPAPAAAATPTAAETTGKKSPYAA